MAKMDDILNTCAEYLDIDRFWRTVGVYGNYQRLQIFILSLHTLTGFHTVTYYFEGYEPPHQCRMPNTTGGLIHNGVNVSDSKLSVQTCSIDVYRNNNSSIEPHIVLPCVYGNNYSLPQDRSVISEFDLVCDQADVGQLPETAVMTGQVVGSLLSFTADMYGRKTIHNVSHISVLSLIMAVAFLENFWLICVFRFVMGAFMQILQLTAIVPYVEIVPTDQRPTLAALLDAVRSMAFVLMGLLAYFLREHSWRIFALVSSVTALPVILNIFFMDESLRWLMVKKKKKEMVKLLTKICKMNKVPVQNIFHADRRCNGLLKSNRGTVDESSNLLESEKISLAILNGHKEHGQVSNGEELKTSESNKNDTTRATSYLNDMKTVLNEPKILLQFIVAWSMWFIDFFMHFSLYLLPNMVALDRYGNFLLTAIASCMGAPIAWAVMVRVSRRRCCVLFHGLSGLGVMISCITRYMSGTSPVFSAISVSFGLIARMSVSFCVSLVKVYTPEIFPTNLRNTLMGIAYFSGRTGGIAASFCVMMASYYDWLPDVVLASGCLIVTVGIVFLPETRDRELPQDIADIKAWNKKKNKQ